MTADAAGRQHRARLNWRGLHTNLSAVGARGTYWIHEYQRAGRRMFILQGRGHDGMVMAALPVGGELFTNLDHAMRAADDYDSMAPAGEASGA